MTIWRIASIQPVYTSGCGLIIHGTVSMSSSPRVRYGGIVARIELLRSRQVHTVDTRCMMSSKPTTEPHRGVAHSTGQPDQACGATAPAGYMTWVLPKPSEALGPTDTGGSGTGLSLGGLSRGNARVRLRPATTSPPSVTYSATRPNATGW